MRPIHSNWLDAVYGHIEKFISQCPIIITPRPDTAHQLVFVQDVLAELVKQGNTNALDTLNSTHIGTFPNRLKQGNPYVQTKSHAHFCGWQFWQNKQFGVWCDDSD